MAAVECSKSLSLSAFVCFRPRCFNLESNPPPPASLLLTVATILTFLPSSSSVPLKTWPCPNERPGFFHSFWLGDTWFGDCSQIYDYDNDPDGNSRACYGTGEVDSAGVMVGLCPNCTHPGICDHECCFDDCCVEPTPAPTPAPTPTCPRSFDRLWLAPNDQTCHLWCRYTDPRSDDYNTSFMHDPANFEGGSLDPYWYECRCMDSDNEVLKECTMCYNPPDGMYGNNNDEDCPVPPSVSAWPWWAVLLTVAVVVVFVVVFWRFILFYFYFIYFTLAPEPEKKITPEPDA